MITMTDQDMENLSELSGRQLHQFCLYWNSGPVSDGSENIRKGSMINSDRDYRKGYYRRHRLSDGWHLYDHKLGDLVILCDEDEKIRLKGNREEIIGLLRNMVYTGRALRNIPDREYGLVLSGGGAKGAFEIGVWRWLEKTGLIHRIRGISGTSVGALNSALFSCSTLEEAEEIWRSIRQEDLTHLNREMIKKAAEALLKTILVTAVKPVTLSVIVKELLPLAGETFFTQKKLSEIADRVLEKPIPDDKIVFACLARQSLQVQTEPPTELVIGTIHNADYYCLNNREKEEKRDIVLASAALPFVYDTIEINHFEYRDGGCRDNTPYMPLVRSGFKKLIVVHLAEKKAGDPVIEMVEGTILFHVYPTLHAKQIIDTIRITGESTDDWISNGEQSASAQLGPLLKDGELVLPDNLNNLIGKEVDMDRFDFENFDYDDAFSRVQSEVSKPNILICGATGVGKSTMIRDFFHMSGDEGPEIGNKGSATTRGIQSYSPEGYSITLFDSQGYDIGSDEQKFMRDVLGTIGDKVKENPDEMTGHIHEVWYCVSAANNRFFEADEKMIREILKKYTTPVMIILTKVDCTDEEGIDALKKVISDKFPGISIFTYASDEKTADWDEETRKQYVQTEEITAWALANLDESLKAGFVPAIKKGLEAKRNYIAGKTIPRYAALAAGTVAATSIINVPFSDSLPLMGLQLKMSFEIIRGYGIRAERQKLAADLLGTSAVTILGRTLASNLIRVLPFAGNVFNATVNTSVAASVTAVLGFSVALVCEQYLAACVDNNGAQNIPFVQYMNSDRLKEAMKYVTDNKKEFNIQEIITLALKNITKVEA